jgi:type III secretory pathway component EscT
MTDQDVTRALALGLLVALRVAPTAILAPWLALRRTPGVVRAAVILALTVTFTPLAMQSAPAALPSPLAHTLPWLAARELVVGLVFALATALPLHALAWGGRLVDLWRGASLAEVLAPWTGERTSPLGHLYLLLGVAVFSVLGGHRLAIAAFAEGLSVAPVGVATFGAGLSEVAFGALRLSASALALALAVAAPAGVTLVAVEASLGLLARTAPQVPVFFAGMPLRAAAGLAALLLGLSFVVGSLPTVLRDAMGAALSLLSAMG